VENIACLQSAILNMEKHKSNILNMEKYSIKSEDLIDICLYNIKLSHVIHNLLLF